MGLAMYGLSKFACLVHFEEWAELCSYGHLALPLQTLRISSATCFNQYSLIYEVMEAPRHEQVDTLQKSGVGAATTDGHQSPVERAMPKHIVVEKSSFDGSSMYVSKEWQYTPSSAAYLGEWGDGSQELN